MSKCAICRKHIENPVIWQNATVCNDCVPKERQSFNYEVYNEDIALQVITRSPVKWMLIDRETGQTYQGNPGGYWDRLDPVIRDNNDRN